MSLVHKSVNANTLSRIWNGVLAKVFFEIGAKISAFPVTATGYKTAITVAVANSIVVHGVFAVQSVLEELCQEMDVVLQNMLKPHSLTLSNKVFP